MSVTDAALGVGVMLSIYLPGHLVGGALVRKGDGLAEAGLIRLAAAAGIATPVLSALAVFGYFGVTSIILSMLVVSGVAWIFARRLDAGVRPCLGGWDGAVFALVVGAFVLYSIPAEYLINSRDPGVYTVVSERLAASGELFKQDRLIDAVSEFHPFYDEEKYPGLFILEGFGGSGSLVVPQFFPGPFALIGAGMLAFGTWGGLYVVPVLGAVSVGVTFALGRELFGRWAGLLGAALLALSYSQLWWARHPSSEVTAQLLVLSGLWFSVRFVKDREATSGLMAGLLLGAAMVVRVDAFLAALALPVLFGYDLFTHRGLRYAARWLYPGIPLALFALASLLYLGTFGSRYLDIIYTRHGLAGFLSVAPLLFVVGAVALGGVAFFLLRGRFGERVGSYLAAKGGNYAFIGAVMVVGVALWGYFVVPVPWEELPAASRDFNAYRPQILLRLVWFTTPAVAVLGFAGLLFAARRVSAGRFIVVGAFLAFGVLYTVLPNVAPDLPWATRRFVPAAFPVLCLLAGYACVEVGNVIGRNTGRKFGGVRLGTVSSVALFAIALGWTIYVVLPIISFRELEGLASQFDEINAEIPPAEVVFMEMPDGYDVSASTFEYAYGRDVLPYDRLRFIREEDRLREAGLLEDSVYVTTDGGPAPRILGLDFKEVGGGRVRAPRLRPAETKVPMEIEYLDIEYRVFDIEALPQAHTGDD